MLSRLTDGRLIDTITGEIMIEELVIRRPDEFVKVQKVKQKQEQQEDEKIIWRKGDYFIKIYIDTIGDVVTSLTGTEAWVAMLLSQYIKPFSNMVCMNGNPVSNADIMSITGYKEQHVIDIMKSLVDKKIFSKNRVGRSNQYFANPFIFTRGNKINSTLYDMFKNYKAKK